MHDKARRVLACSMGFVAEIRLNCLEASVGLAGLAFVWRFGVPGLGFRVSGAGCRNLIKKPWAL